MRVLLSHVPDKKHIEDAHKVNDLVAVGVGNNLNGSCAGAIEAVKTIPSNRRGGVLSRRKAQGCDQGEMRVVFNGDHSRTVIAVLFR